MPQVFRPRANALVILIAGVVLVVFLGVGIGATALEGSPYATGEGSIPEQPVPFSHQHHVAGLGIDCRYCHTGVERSSFAGMPATDTCMTCHSQIWTNAQMLQPVRNSLASNEPLRWVRVHDLADYVYFSHQVHVNNGVGCESCHGRVDQMPLMRQTEPLTMQWCLDCHRNPKPNLRPPDRITAMGYQPSEDQQPGKALLAHYAIDVDEMTECVACHR
jgi:hypothetical protein